MLVPACSAIAIYEQVARNMHEPTAETADLRPITFQRQINPDKHLLGHILSFRPASGEAVAHGHKRGASAIARNSPTPFSSPSQAVVDQLLVQTVHRCRSMIFRLHCETVLGSAFPRDCALMEYNDGFEGKFGAIDQ